MPDNAPATPTGGVLEPQQHQSRRRALYTRRARPADLELELEDASRVPLGEQSGKLSRRRSRLALSGLFGRNRSDKQPQSPTVESKLSPGRSGGIRASLAGIGNWPYSPNGQKSEITLPSIPQAAELEVTVSPPSADLKQGKPSAAAKDQTAVPKSSRSTWDPPPLFKAYPQSIKHAHLTATTLPAEALLKLQNQKGGISSKAGPDQSSLEQEPGEKSDADSPGSKKRHLRNTSAASTNIEWTTKVYMLVTSGYLLQYSGEGSYDRRPEKVLQLGRNSAAFASDVIPGRHWVLQVSSVTDPGGGGAAPSNSLLSRFPFRGAERRNASTLLMVFEKAEDMDGWIATLRREIEMLGGKKNLSETGKPKAENAAVRLRARTSQRTIIARDSDRYSRPLSRTQWDPAASAASPGPNADGSDLDTYRQRSFDETSTASGISQEARQLDGLRDSTNRLSYVSSGQRTMVTSAGSSPACSPIRDSFISQPEERPNQDTPPAESQLRALPRPNAAAIVDRRQSIQAVNRIFDLRSTPAGDRPHSTTSSSSRQPENAAAQSNPAQSIPHCIPHFSVPQSVGKRFSITRTPPPDDAPLTQGLVQSRIPPSRSQRRPPPSALSINPRPLSLVQDFPSPLLSPHDRIRRGIRLEGMGIPDSPTIVPIRGSTAGSSGSRNSLESGPRRPSPLQQKAELLAPADDSPSKHSSIATIKAPDMNMASRTPTDVPRSKSAAGDCMRSQSPAPTPALDASRWAKRSSVQSTMSEIIPRCPATEPDLRTTSSDSPNSSRSLGGKAQPELELARDSASRQHLRRGSSQSLQNRHSTTQVAEGPPPAPPPTCALPPVPPRKGL